MDSPPTRRHRSPSQLSPQPSSPPSTAGTTTTTTTRPTTARITATSTTHSHSCANRQPPRTPPHLPTRAELLLLALYPALLAFGTLYAALSPVATRAAAAHQAQGDPAPPSYFARKDNVLNLAFVKRGWGWVTAAFVAWLWTATGTGTGTGTRRRRVVAMGAAQTARAVVRWAMVTAWWVFVTQWFFGAPLIDRGFRWSGGRCEEALEQVVMGDARKREVATAAACRASGGSWRGGHDISGHVFLLVLGSAFLIQEVGWVMLRGWREGQWIDERCVVMPDGAVKSAGVEAERREDGREQQQQHQGGQEEGVMATVWDALGPGGKMAAAVVGLCVWMLLMTAIFFHTWFEKLTGLLVALVGLYAVYILPRWVPALRAVVGLPGV
ncbi:hypothetical protein VTK26DRAFT_8164 [Humicola hyalothermophila]